MTTPPGAAAENQQSAIPAGTAAEVILSREQLAAGREWVRTGSLRLTRRVVTATRTVEVTVRREELVIETDDVQFRDGVGTGVSADARPAHEPIEEPGPPLVVVLREEVPEVSLSVAPYEQVTVTVSRVRGSAEIAAELRHEDVNLDRS